MDLTDSTSDIRLGRGTSINGRWQHDLYLAREADEAKANTMFDSSALLALRESMAASDTSLQLALTYLQELLDSVQQGHSGRAAEIGQSRLTTALAEATNIIELCLRGEDTVEPAAIGSINTDQTTFASIDMDSLQSRFSLPVSHGGERLVHRIDRYVPHYAPYLRRKLSYNRRTSPASRYSHVNTEYNNKTRSRPSRFAHHPKYRQQQPLLHHRQVRKSIVVRGLAAGTSPADVKTVFQEFGSIVHATALDEPGRISVFVQFHDESAIPEAISAMNGVEADGVIISVDRASGREHFIR